MIELDSNALLNVVHLQFEAALPVLGDCGTLLVVFALFGIGTIANSN